MKLFLLIFISATLGLIISISLYKFYMVDVSPLFFGLFINAIGLYILRDKANEDCDQ